MFVNGTGNAGNDEGHSTNFISNNGEIKTTELVRIIDTGIDY
ncbi:hypothetical protein [Clostridium sartagoforme]|nr:hypothetical protein [Clostridium sartagoforme]